jgi:phage terminase small subunit
MPHVDRRNLYRYCDFYRAYSQIVATVREGPRMIHKAYLTFITPFMTIQWPGKVQR